MVPAGRSIVVLMMSLRYCCVQDVRNLRTGCMKSKRTQADRSAATQAALVTAARPLFAAKGYAAVGTDEVARAAGVTRGALYHQFAGKEELFAAVFEQVEAEITDRIALGLLADGGDPARVLQDGSDAWLAA